MRRESGRISLLTIFAIFVVVAGIAGFVFAGQSVDNVGVSFMDALARGDVKKLTELSDMPGRSPQEIEKEWDFAVNKVGKYYRFAWDVLGGDVNGEDRGYVRLHVQRNLESGSSYDENYQLPMHRVNGKWKVVVGEISPEMYPAIPR